MKILKCTTVIAPPVPLESYISIDLSSANKDLEQFDVSLSSNWESYLESYLKRHDKQIAYGGYLERRALYDRSDYFNHEDKQKQRCIHLGLDLWIEAGTSVLAAFDAKVHSFKNNTNFGDYGPTIILEHTINNEIFYTLYGHLSLGSIEGLKIGEKFAQGDVIGYLGDAKVNGDYAPHLHFQIIKDLQGNFGDYPGVSNLNDLEFYKTNCPDPKPFLGLI
tara:strand:- start:2506 stop:3165 length:660 start_codon:yes stop_codon:yes gene_type:complete